MNKDQAFEAIQQGLNLASQKGAFTLQGSAALFSALQVIKNTFLDYDYVLSNQATDKKDEQEVTSKNNK